MARFKISSNFCWKKYGATESLHFLECLQLLQVNLLILPFRNYAFNRLLYLVLPQTSALDVRCEGKVFFVFSRGTLRLFIIMQPWHLFQNVTNFVVKSNLTRGVKFIFSVSVSNFMYLTNKNWWGEDTFRNFKTILRSISIAENLNLERRRNLRSPLKRERKCVLSLMHPFYSGFCTFRHIKYKGLIGVWQWDLWSSIYGCSKVSCFFLRKQT